ncbi:hypothetical protein KDX06_23495, partial [Burkholderia vietnamiensis]|nr:hypothetical protein [Burkholderia vietnamiensis]
MTVSADTSPPRIALVAGALGSAADAATLGRALATQFAQRGWDVALQRSPGAPLSLIHISEPTRRSS